MMRIFPEIQFVRNEIISFVFCYRKGIENYQIKEHLVSKLVLDAFLLIIQSGRA